MVTCEVTSQEPMPVATDTMGLVDANQHPVVATAGS